MTYPPQQPPGPPGPYGPQDPYGQQPYGQQPYGQGPPWAGGQPGYPVGPPQKKSRTGLITSLIIVAILVVGGGGVGAYLLLKNDDKDSSAGGGGSDTPRAAADSFTKAMSSALSTRLEDVDLKPLKPLTCAADYTKLTDSLDDARKYSSTSASAEPEKTTFGVKDFKETSDGAAFTMTQKQGSDESDFRDMDVLKEQGAWKVCGLFKETDGGGSSGEGSSDSSPSSGGGGNGGIPNPIPKTS